MVPNYNRFKPLNLCTSLLGTSDCEANLHDIFVHNRSTSVSHTNKTICKCMTVTISRPMYKTANTQPMNISCWGTTFDFRLTSQCVTVQLLSRGLLWSPMNCMSATPAVFLIFDFNHRYICCRGKKNNSKNNKGGSIACTVTQKGPKVKLI